MNTKKNEWKVEYKDRNIGTQRFFREKNMSKKKQKNI